MPRTEKEEIELMMQHIPKVLKTLIRAFGKGPWVECIKCGILCNTHHATQLFSFKKEKVYRCKNCNDLINAWGQKASEEFPFD